MLKSLFANLKSFFIIIAAFIVLSSTIIFFIFLSVRNSQNKNIVFNKNLNKISYDLIKLKKTITDFKEVKHPAEYYLYKKDTYSDEIYYLLYSIKNSNEKIYELNSENNFEITTIINNNKDISDNFEADFKLLNENLQKLGNSGNGYYEHILQAENKTDKILNEYPQLKNKFQKLKILKTNLLLSGNPKSENDFLTAEHSFLQSLRLDKTVFKSVSEKQIVINNTAEWFNTVLSVFKLKKINGTSYYSGLFDNLVSQIQEIKNNIITIQNADLTIRTAHNKKLLINSVIFLFIFTLVLILSVFGFYTYVKKQINILNIKLSEIASVKTDKLRDTAEFEQAKNYADMIKDKINETVKYVNNLTDEKYDDTKDNLISDDILGNKLIALKKHLIKKQEKQKHEEQLRAISDRHKDGIVKFGKIIRHRFGNINELTFDLLTELVHFLNADIGGIYVIDKNKNPDILVLKASYAYNKKKIINKEIKIGNGLVGTCAADKSIVYIDKTDDDYIKIVSGFGYTKPKSLLLSPIYVENEVFGVIELASSKTFTKEDIIFIETISEDIAYTLSYLLKQNQLT
ncbi:MAG: GAF domain-containing protein [Chlorobi bacterium]|nr:GAF domain-containing protein [Chlorobiota bacterium]